jgi:hypothetical protein
MSQILVSEIKSKLTLSKIGTCFTFPRDASSKIAICLFTLLAMQEPPPFRCLNPIAACSFTWNTICVGKTLPVQQAWIS